METGTLPSSFGRNIPRPIEPEFQGLATAPKMAQAASMMTKPLEDAAQTVATAGVEEQKFKLSQEENRKAMEFQKILRGGPQYMLKFAEEIGQTNPQLGQQLRAEAEGLAPLFQDPQIKGDRAEDILTGFYKSALDRQKAVSQDRGALEVLKQQNRMAFEEVRQRNRLALEEAKNRLWVKYGRKGSKDKLDFKVTMEEASELLKQTEDAISTENMVLEDPNSTSFERMGAMQHLASLNTMKRFALAQKLKASQHGEPVPGAVPDKTPPPAPAPNTPPDPKKRKYRLIKN